MDRATLAQTLDTLEPFQNPRADLEQYSTSADLASRLLHLADIHGDIDRPVLDLGTGTGVLAIGAALLDTPQAIGLDRDPTALRTARHNTAHLEFPTHAPTWLLADATTPPIPPTNRFTVVANPPFGAQNTAVDGDRAFLETIAAIGMVSYTIHNEDSLDFLEAFTADHDATITHAYAAELTLPQQFAWHTTDTKQLSVEVVRIEW